MKKMSWFAMIFVSVFSLAAYSGYAKGAHSGGHGGGHHVKPASSGHRGHVHPHPGPGPRPQAPGHIHILTLITMYSTDTGGPVIPIFTTITGTITCGVTDHGDIGGALPHGLV